MPIRTRKWKSARWIRCYMENNNFKVRWQSQDKSKYAHWVLYEDTRTLHTDARQPTLTCGFIKRYLQCTRTIEALFSTGNILCDTTNNIKICFRDDPASLSPELQTDVNC